MKPDHTVTSMNNVGLFAEHDGRKAIEEEAMVSVTQKQIF